MAPSDGLSFDMTVTQGAFRLRAGFSLPRGARVAVLGGSGAGKSTLLMALAGFVPAMGSILWQGQEIGGLEPGERPVAMLFQDQNLFPHLTLMQNLGLALNPRLRLGPDQRARISAVLERLGLGGMETRRPSELSGGQQGRAALGRVLLQNRPILALDEPFSALGPALKADLLALVAELAAEAGTTVLMVTHDPEDARRFASHVVLVHDGLADAPVETGAIFADPPPALRAYLG
ncbi:thiamine ABC transporter ATP-binding protein [Stagnihabitans tardus]|uniref:ATP-binding cassette domain-containing protein n=1 Tax=Stagnihabitans tardus TaxID=2699202 RepID=A0AAE4Y810_9RHOB|nr:ATP-binding cassette domain-containing protein [Stagnihabitans tardus]NBZ86546.1 ATP-binding cassette domain-containing protein [Stagnihabitans tardus]